MNDLYAVIFAGGVGSRLWPVSRVSSPKQVKPFLGSSDTLIQRTWRRVRRVLPAENIYLSTTADYAEAIAAQLPELSKTNLIIEPELRNTCPAIGLATGIIHKRHPGAIVMNVWADHHYGLEDAYVETIRKSYTIIQKHPEQIMSVGLHIEYPSTALGYLEVEMSPADEDGALKVKRFVEKPDVARAGEFMRAGNYFWNPALFMWRAGHMLELYRQHVPETYQGLAEIIAAWDTAEQDTVLRKIYPGLTKIALEYAVLEKGPSMLLLPARLGWRDIGNWQAVHDVLQSDGEGVATKGKAVTIEAKDVLVFNEDDRKLVTVVGLENVAVINTSDAVLVIKKSRDQDVKKLVEKMEKEEKLRQYL
ncbi:mannose-1-phosphate guanylyltransferase [Patescibacteria group bacterium]|nr:mannose-1-phosphate guanylyltransferase [Patescibacteria group bacterium]